MDDLGLLALLPAVVAIALAVLTREVLVSLLLGVVTGSVVLWWHTGAVDDLNPLTRFLLPALGTQSFAAVLLIYLWCLGGLVGVWERTGSARHFAEVAGARFVRGPRTALVFAWVIGCVFHQGGTVSTVLAGTTIKPLTDQHRVSHEELAFIVDSTASPVATLLPFNAWPGYVAGLVVGTVPLLATADDGVALFFASLRYNFYAMFAVGGTLLFALGWLPWAGSGLRAARERARSTGALDAPGARPLRPPANEERRYARYQPSLLDFALPLALLIGVSVGTYAASRLGWLSRGYINEAFVLCTLSAMGVAWAQGLPGREVLDGFVDGCRDMTVGALILGLAVTLGFVAKELHAAQAVVDVVGDGLPAVALPAALTALCMGIALSTGTSWGTYAVVFPVALPLAWALHPEPWYLQLCFGAVLGGAVYGDQCSPISDTTVLASIFTGCDLVDHVRTQLPPATVAAALGAIASTTLAWWWL